MAMISEFSEFVNVNKHQNLPQLRMEVREETFGVQTKRVEQANFSVYISKDTENLVLTDSQGKHLNHNLILGRGKTHITKCYTVDDTSDFVGQLSNGSKRTKVKYILVNTGINDIKNRMSHHQLAEKQYEYIKTLQSACPNAKIIYSLPLSRKKDRQVEELGIVMWEYYLKS